MKQALTLSLIFLFSISINLYGQVGLDNYQLNAEFKGIDKKSNFEGYKVLVTLISHSSDTFKYNSMSCSWQRFFCTNNKNWGVLIDVCNHDFPTTVTLPPKKDTTMALLIFPINKKLTPVDLKIGMDVINPGTLSTVYSYEGVTDRKSKRILWSTIISLKSK